MSNVVIKLRSGLIFVAIAVFLLGLVSFFRFVTEFNSLDQYGEIESSEIKGFLVGQWVSKTYRIFFGNISQSITMLICCAFH